MKLGWFGGVACAVLMHVAFLLFGGIFFLDDDVDHGTLQQVELLAETVEDEKDEEKPVEERPDEELESEVEEAPDVAELLRSLEPAPSLEPPALDAATLSAIEDALSGAASGASDFADALNFASGGRIGGTGRGGAIEESLESAIDLADVDQEPRVVFQTAPLFPSEMRGKKIEGHVTLTFVVDATGKVINPRVEKSTHPAFEKPALDAVKQWKFEPGVKSGKRVPRKMRVPLRFQPS